MKTLPSRAVLCVKASKLSVIGTQAAGRCRMSHLHMHCARGAVIRQDIGDEQAEPPYPSRVIGGTGIVDRILRQNLGYNKSSPSIVALGFDLRSVFLAG